MSKQFLSKYLPIISAGLIFAVIVLLLNYSKQGTLSGLSPSPLASGTPAVTPVPASSAKLAPSPTPSAIEPTISSPAVNAKVTSPLTIIGTVPAGWMFEGSFPLKLVDKQRNVIVQGIAQEKVPGSWTSGQPVAFVAALEFTTNEKSGFLVLDKDNPSGLPENDDSFQIPLRFSN